ncbi:DUF5681 domain-containing protein [Hyphomonas sp. GM-8P]|uniref:DUF5681 domain-containing protein n=1 Tax=Hyphomonas sp. GM-8P TaxID=1280945 RepID=UPI000DBF5383|nr:DUF5681 domain-containing protein [Hyphomonas sp. GM-8P]RAN37761.1 hypothetical protein HY26_18580 [Hyphomonas sp. GM-8P]
MSKEPIGYSKPPKKSQFKPGQSGNPKGRPKGAKSLRSVVQKELASKIEIRVQGKKTRTTKLEAAVMKLVNDALSGNVNALAELLKLAAIHLPQDTGMTAANMPATAEDEALLKKFLARTLASKKGQNDSD